MIDIPLVGLGTYQLIGRECTRVVKEALKIGYRHLDTAHIYGNHKAIGRAIQDISREDLFLTSKLAIEQIQKNKIEKSIEQACRLALKELGVEYLDLYLLHWPDRSLPMVKILKAMEHLKEEGWVKSIGVSNCTIHHLQDLLKGGVEQIEVNQVEFHPYLYQKKLWTFCLSHHMQLVSYRPLGKGALLKEPLFKEIAQKHEKNPAQILLRWMVQKKIPVIPKASSKKHLIENFSLFDFKLSAHEMAKIDKLHRNERFCDTNWSEFNY